MGAALGSLTEIRELRSEITGLRTDLKRFIERANQQHVDAVLCDLRSSVAGAVADHQVKTAETGLASHMAGDCAMREQCYGIFMEFLQKTAKHISGGEIAEDMVASYREQIKAMRKKGPFDRCDTCFAEVHRLFEKQIDLMLALGVYKKEPAPGSCSPAETDDAAVPGLLEPLASVQRFQIAKALAIQSRTFSDLSQLTGLRGGNLLFHIRKLTDADMVLQRHERGDYILTEKGFLTLQAVAELHRRVGGK